MTDDKKEKKEKIGGNPNGEGTAAPAPWIPKTPLQVKLLEGLIAGKSVYQAGKDAGYADSSIDAKRLIPPDMRAAFRQALADRGIGPEKLAETLGGALAADKAIMTQDGPAIIGPDHPVRLQAYDRAARALSIDGENSGENSAWEVRVAALRGGGIALAIQGDSAPNDSDYDGD